MYSERYKENSPTQIETCLSNGNVLLNPPVMSSFILVSYEAVQVLAFGRCAWEVPFEEQLMDIKALAATRT